jgi:hypothetical protein
MAARPAMEKATALDAAHRAGLDLLLRVIVLAAAVALFRLRGAPGAARGAATRGGDDAARTAPRLPWQVAVAAVALPVVLVADLGSVLRPALARSTGPAPVLHSTPMPELARIGAAEPHVRVASARPPVVNAPGREGLEPQAEFLINDWIRWRARSLGGGHSAKPAVWREGGALFRSYAAMCALGVVYISLAPGASFDPALFEKVRETGDEVVLRVRAALGRLYAVPRVVAAGNDVATVEAMISDRFDPRVAALAAERGPAGEYPGSIGCEVSWIEDEPDHLAFDVEAPDRAFVVLADTWFPGWKARVDDAPVALHRVNQVARGIALPAGRHRVTMRYTPEGWNATVPVTRAAMALWLAGALVAAAWSVRRRINPKS